MSTMALKLEGTKNMRKIHFLKKIPKNDFRMKRFQNDCMKVYQIHFHVDSCLQHFL